MAIVYANLSNQKNVGTGGSWQNYSSGSDGIYYVGVGGTSGSNNYISWFGFPTGFADPNIYEITSATLHLYQNYYSYVSQEATNTTTLQIGSLSPSGTNSISNVTWSYSFNTPKIDGTAYTADCTAGAIAIQQGSSNGIQISSSGNSIYTEIVAHPNSNSNILPRIEYTTKLRSFYCIPHTTDSNKGSASGGGTAEYGQPITITAHPNTGYHFVRWQTANGSSYSTSNPLTLTSNVNIPTDLYAVFEINTYSVSINSRGNGSVSGSGTYSHGSTCTASASPNTGYSFLQWESSNSSYIASVNPYSFTVTSSQSLYARFQINSYRISVGSLGDKGSSYVSGGGQFNYNTQTTVNAVAATGFRFVKWVESADVNASAVSTSASYTFTVTYTRDLYAVFERLNYTITVSVGSGSGTVSGGGTYSYESTCILSASSSTGWQFVNWSNGSTSNPYSFTVTSNGTYNANFAQINYSLNLQFASGNENRGVLSGSGTYHLNDIVTIIATPNISYKFIGWATDVEGTNIVYTNASQNITITGNLTLYAVFDYNSAIHIWNTTTNNWDLYLPYVQINGVWTYCETYVYKDDKYILCI